MAVTSMEPVLPAHFLDAGSEIAQNNLALLTSSITFRTKTLVIIVLSTNRSHRFTKYINSQVMSYQIADLLNAVTPYIAVLLSLCCTIAASCAASADILKGVNINWRGY